MTEQKLPMEKLLEASEVAVLRDEVSALVRDRRHEEALERLYDLRELTPDEPDVMNSIKQMKEFLITRYAKALGGLDTVAGPIPVKAARSPEAMSLVRLIDGVATYDDVARTSSLGRFRTLQLLCELYGVESDYKRAQQRRPTVEFAPRPRVEAKAVEAKAVEARGVEAKAPEVEAPSEAKPIETKPSDSFESLFQRATHAYLMRHYDEAEAAFKACQALRPEDGRVRVNLERLAARKSP